MSDKLLTDELNRQTKIICKLLMEYLELKAEHELLLEEVGDLDYVCDFMNEEGDYCRRNCTPEKSLKTCYNKYAKIVLERRNHED